MAAAARHTGIAQPTLFNIMKRKYHPRADTLAKLARSFGVTFDFISGRSERAHDDTFESGAYAAIRVMRRDLERLENMVESGEFGPKSATNPTVGATTPVVPPEFFSRQERDPSISIEPKPKRDTRKRRA